MTETQMQQYLASLKRVRALYTALIDAQQSNAAQHVDYARHLASLDQRMALAEMHLSARGLSRAMRAGEVDLFFLPVADNPDGA
jgi:hypothetical protein